MTASPISGSRTVPAGGPGTINGVLYQLLWSLLRASKAHVVDVSTSPGGELQKTTLTLEPIAGGGDLVVGTASGRIVEQVKARPDGRKWSLRAIVEDVIPDLYLASSANPNDTEYRFVTEGEMGQWKDVYSFFQSLRAYCPSDEDPLPSLDQVIPLKFGGARGSQPAKTGARDSFWELETYTQVTLFERIVSEVRKRPAVSSEPIETTRRRMWKVLSRFTFFGGQAMQDVESQIDAFLLGLADHHERIPEIRDAMAFDLGRRATAGSATIDASEFLKEHGLDAVPLNNWSLFRTQSQRHVDGFLSRHGYLRDLDVRFENAIDQICNWPPTRPILAISGESGQGKSWRAYATALTARSLSCATVIVESAGDADATLGRVAKTVWNEIGNHDAPIDFSQIARRVQHVLKTEHARIANGYWLFLIIDGIHEPEEARQLFQQPWEEWGVRSALVCSPHVARQVQRDSPLRCFQISVSDFRIQELQDYLHRAIGEEWTDIPEYIREPLRRPLLAHIYCRLAEESHLHPSNEYGLYQSLWDRLLESDPFGAIALKQIGDALLDGRAYPLSIEQLGAASIDQVCLRRLERSGWLRTVTVSPRPQFEIAHDRLLNWLVAAVLVDRLTLERETPEIVAERLKSFLSHHTTVGGRGLGFVPMDTIWLMLRAPQTRDKVVAVLDRLKSQPILEEILYTKLIPTLGDEVVDVLLEQLRSRMEDWRLPHQITKAIGHIGGDKAKNAARQLLEESNPYLQRAAMRIFAEVPVADVLDRLWQLQVAVKRDPTPFLAEHESKYNVLGESFKALDRCCALRPEWLEERIADITEGDPAAETLTNLVAGIGGAEGKALWLRNKKALFAKVAPKTQRCLATCIDVFADVSETDWLINRLSSTDDLVCSKALSALARLNPGLAVEHLDKLPRRVLSSTRHWYGNRLFAVRQSSVQAKLLQLMREGGPSWEIASVYDGREYLLDTTTARYLLDDLTEFLAAYLAEPDGTSSEPELHSRLDLLGSLGTVEQLEAFSERRGSPLAGMLLELLGRIGPRRGVHQDSFLRDPAFAVLQRIGGEEYTTAVSRFLIADSQHARYDAIHRSARRPNSETIHLLQQITESDNYWDGGIPDRVPLEQHAAAEVLADVGEWDHVIGLVSQFGLRTFSTITDLPRQGHRPPAAIVEPVRARVISSMERAAPGDVLAIGIGGNPTDSCILLRIVERCSPDSDIAHACAIGLELLEDHSAEAVPFLAKLLPYHDHSATNALIVNGTKPAAEALWDHTQRRFEVVSLIHVLNHLSHPENVVDKVKSLVEQQLESNGFWNFNQNLDLLVRHVRSDEIVAELLADEKLREHLRRQSFADEGNSWITGSKAACIRVLARFDREAAFVAARTALRNPEWHDRDHYPYILLDLAPKDAVPELLRQLSVEEDATVARAICRALLCEGIDDHLLVSLSSDDRQILRAACLAAGWASKSDAVERRLTTLVGDPDEEVSDAAATAICRLRLRAESRKLTEAIMSATDSEERWRLLDCLVQVSDPGDVHRLWPREGAPIGELLSPLQVRYCTKQLEEKRKKLATDKRIYGA